MCNCFKAHLIDKVRELAAEFNILLIIVPANGTGKFQQLDRIIFRIIKSKLRALDGTTIFQGKERFEQIYNHLTKAWSEITKDHLKSARSIPGLKDRIEKIKKSDTGNSDFDINDEKLTLDEAEEEDMVEYYDPHKDEENIDNP